MRLAYVCMEDLTSKVRVVLVIFKFTFYLGSTNKNFNHFAENLLSKIFLDNMQNAMNRWKDGKVE